MKLRIRLFSLFSMATILVTIVAMTSQAIAMMILYKAAIVLVGAVIGYIIDRIVFPYARPDSYLDWPWEEEKRLGFRTLNPNHRVSLGYKYVFAATLIRRSIIIGLSILAMSLA